MHTNSINSYDLQLTRIRGVRLTILGLALLGVGILPEMAVAVENGSALESQKGRSGVFLNRNAIQNNSQLLAQSNGTSPEKQRAFDTFFASQYTYWDAAVLSKFWNQSLGDTKAQMGNKILWGPSNQALLDQCLLDGRIKALGAANHSLSLYPESSFKYQDAEALAKFWGDPSPYDAKVRIEKNLIMGKEENVKKALVLAKNTAPVQKTQSKKPAPATLINCGIKTGANSQTKMPAAATLSLQCGIQPGANGRNRIPISRNDPAYLVQKLDISPAIYLDVTFPDGTKAGPHDYKKNFASNIIFDDKTGDPNDLIRVLYWDIDSNNPQRGKYAAQLTSTGKGTGTAYLKVSFRNAPEVTAAVPVQVVSGTGM